MSIYTQINPVKVERLIEEDIAQTLEKVILKSNFFKETT